MPGAVPFSFTLPPRTKYGGQYYDSHIIELLLAGVSKDQVSLLLGHSGVKVTERHYAPFVKDIGRNNLRISP